MPARNAEKYLGLVFNMKLAEIRKVVWASFCTSCSERRAPGCDPLPLECSNCAHWTQSGYDWGLGYCNVDTKKWADRMSLCLEFKKKWSGYKTLYAQDNHCAGRNMRTINALKSLSKEYGVDGKGIYYSF